MRCSIKIKTAVAIRQTKLCRMSVYVHGDWILNVTVITYLLQMRFIILSFLFVSSLDLEKNIKYITRR
jgi:hypothetical protein